MSHISESGFVAHFWLTDHLLPAMILLMTLLLTAWKVQYILEQCLCALLLKFGFHPICADWGDHLLSASLQCEARVSPVDF